MPENLAYQYFIGQAGLDEEDKRQYDKWYSTETLEHLNYIIPQPQATFRYIFLDGWNFVDQFQQIKVLLTSLEKQSVAFITIEPGSKDSRIPHFLFGMTLGEDLLVVDPLGEINHRDFYQTIIQLRERNLVQKVFISTTTIQYDGVSCGPLCLELLVHFSNLAPNKLKKLSLDSKRIKRHGLEFHSVEISALLSASLTELDINRDDIHKEIINKIRHNHAGGLQKESQNNFQLDLLLRNNELLPIKKIMLKLKNQEINPLTIAKDKDFLILKQESNQQLDREFDYINLQTPNLEVRIVIDSAEKTGLRLQEEYLEENEPIFQDSRLTDIKRYHIFRFLECSELLYAQNLRSLEKYRNFYYGIVLGLYKPLFLQIKQQGYVSRPLERGPYRGLYPLHALAASSYGFNILTNGQLKFFKGLSYLQLIRLLKTQTNQADVYGAVPLAYTLQRGDIAFSRFLLRNATDVSPISNQASQRIFRFNHVDEWIIRTYTGATILHYAALSGNVKLVKLVLKHVQIENSGLLSTQTEEGYIPLHLAFYTNNPDPSQIANTVLFLLKLADEQILNLMNQAPLKIDNVTHMNIRACIFTAMENQDIQLLEKLFRINSVRALINDFDGGYAFVHWSLMHGAEVLSVFLKYGADPNLDSFMGQRPLDLAILNNWQDRIELLIAHGAYVPFPTTKDYMQQKLKACSSRKEYDKNLHIFLAEYYEVKAFYKQCIARYQPIDRTHLQVRNALGDTQLHKACRELNINEVERLLVVEHINPDTKNALNLTALMELTQRSHSKDATGFFVPADTFPETKVCRILELLKRYNANFNIQDAVKRTALHIAFQFNNFAIIPLLFQYGCDPTIGDFFYFCLERTTVKEMLKLLTVYNLVRYRSKHYILHTAIEIFHHADKEDANKKVIQEILKEYGNEILDVELNSKGTPAKYASDLNNKSALDYISTLLWETLSTEDETYSPSYSPGSP